MFSIEYRYTFVCCQHPFLTLQSIVDQKQGKGWITLEAKQGSQVYLWLKSKMEEGESTEIQNNDEIQWTSFVWRMEKSDERERKCWIRSNSVPWHRQMSSLLPYRVLELVWNRVKRGNQELEMKFWRVFCSFFDPEKFSFLSLLKYLLLSLLFSLSCCSLLILDKGEKKKVSKR